jgi:4-amino-4-deoxy-L-arabinose transferase-like glycosyltransferase
MATVQNKKELLILLLILGLGLFLRVYKLDELIPFLGDQGWFYISARDTIINHTTPLVGIASSHPWLHQGALWTYILAFLFWLFNFNPITPAYFTAILDVLAIIILYKVVSDMFSVKHGLIASFLYATSPLIIMQSRLAYHTSIIPFFMILFIYSLYKWTNGSIVFFPIIFFLLGILYNLEIATAVLWVIFLILFIYGFWKRKKWATKILNYKTILYSAIAFILPMLPMLIYDTQHGYPQTIKFIAWIGYKILKLFGYPSIHPQVAEESYKSILTFMGDKIQQLIFSPDLIVSISLFVMSLILIIYFSTKALKKNTINNLTIIFLSVTVSVVGLILAKTASDAYLPMLFPGILIMLCVFFGMIMANKKLTIIVILIVISMGAINSFYLIKNNYYTSLKFTQKLDTAQEIISQANGKPYTIAGDGNLSASYGYLTWWLGQGPSKTQEKLQFTIKEYNSKIEVIKKIKI